MRQFLRVSVNFFVKCHSLYSIIFLISALLILILHQSSKTGRTLVKALFECVPAFPLSHACIVTDKLQQIPFWVSEVQWRRGAKHVTTRVRSHLPLAPTPRGAFS